jgi:hypothetical protein
VVRKSRVDHANARRDHAHTRIQEIGVYGWDTKDVDQRAVEGVVVDVDVGVYVYGEAREHVS